MIVLRYLALLPCALCFNPLLRITPKRIRMRSPQQLRYISSDKGYIGQESGKFPRPTVEALSTTEFKPNAHGVVNNRHSSSDWLYNLRTMFKSTILKEIKNPVLTLAAWATCISLIQRTLKWTGNTVWASKMCMPSTAHSFLVSSLGLLLVFRTNSAYQRFLEGRKIWEQVLTVSRNLSRMITLYRGEIGTEKMMRMKNLLATFPYLLRHHVRSGCLCHSRPQTLDENVKLILNEPSTEIVDARYEGDKASGGAYNPSDVHGTNECFVDRRDLPWRLIDDPKQGTLEKLARETNRPLWVCDRLGQEIMEVAYSEQFTSRERLSMFGSVEKLTNAIGQCERIHQTAVPLNYARHSLRGLTLWLFTVPFCMVKELGMLTGPATAVIAWLLFGVYQIGHTIEDPFQGSLRLSMLCDAIRRDVLADNRVGSPRSSAYKIKKRKKKSSAKAVEDFESEDSGADENVDSSNGNLTSYKIPGVLEGAPKLVLENGTWTVIGLKP